MVINAAKLLRDGDVVIVGVGLPNLACNLARLSHAPNLVMVYEAGVIGARPDRLPLSIGDPSLVSGALAVCSMYEVFAYYLQRGLISVGFLGGAQIDRFGNLNATVIGEYDRPTVRLPGSGGSQEIAAWAERTYVITRHEARRFPERCDFVTSSGRRSARGGLAAVVTDLAVLEPDQSGELTLTATHPDVPLEAVLHATGWPLKAAAGVRLTDPPTDVELSLLRSLDSDRVYLGQAAL